MRVDGPVALVMLAPLLGSIPGRVPDAFEALAPVLRERGHPVVVASRHEPRVRRAADMVATIRRHRREVDVAVVHVYSGNAFVVADLVSTVARSSGLATVAYLSGGGLAAMAERHPRWVDRVLGSFDARAAPSSFLAEMATGRGHRTEVIPNPLARDRYHHRPRAVLRPTILWMRAFHDVYDPLTALRAFAVVHAARPDARLTMAGPDKGLQGETEREAERLGLTDAVSFPGFLDATAKRRAFDDHDLFLHTNVVDNAPVALQEAAGSGLVIVAARVGGVPHLVGEDVAVLVPPRDPEASAAALLGAIDDPVDAAARSEAGRALATAADPDRVGEAWDAMLGRVVSRR